MTTTQPTLFTVWSTKPVDIELFGRALRRTTTGDRWAIAMLAEHRVLTTGQLTALGFHATAEGTERRLRILARRGWLTRFLVLRGDIPAIETAWSIGPFGAALTSPLAEPLPNPARVFQERDRLRADPRTAVLLDTNQWFVDLAAYARTRPGTDLRTWWSPRTCSGVLAPARHAAWHGELVHHGRRHGFWLEPDPGDVPVAPIADRVHRYPDLAQRTGVATVLFHAADARREAAIRRRLDRANLTGLTVATTSRGHGDPAEAVWLPVRGEQRLALQQLPVTEQVCHPNDDAHVTEAENLAPHPIRDPNRPYDEAVVDGAHSYIERS
ncbi:MAG TPA: replication-relaxation family protein [Micromonosporaceae bacterium]|nr:replication-relaxation family protein [Micromonosporaceae bacterium]